MGDKDVFLSLVAPAYNEDASIEAVIRGWQEVLSNQDYSTEIVICNDGSTDRTVEILEGLKSEYPNLRVVHSSRNKGYGDALSRAIQASRGDYVVTIDSDGQFDLRDYPRLLDMCMTCGYEAVTGYRMGKKDTFIRVLADRFLNLIMRLFFGMRFNDTNCALKVFRGDLIRGIEIEARSYPTPTEIMIKIDDLGVRMGEIGIQHRERMAGKSHLKVVRSSFSMGLFLIYLGCKKLLKRLHIINRI